ncbi:MAG: molybdopterin molybdotransferase MoeA, partial [Tepidisphaeraceae bacterium]
MISLESARTLLLDGIAPMAAEQVALADAAGRILAVDLVASFDQPALPTSAMDGYAITAADAVAGAQLRLFGDAFAGMPFAGRVEGGTAVRIATGGVVPDGAERVIMQEVVACDGDDVTLTGPIHDALFVRPAGGDFRNGDLLLAVGETLTPGALGLAAAANQAKLLLRTRPRVAIFASGDELCEAGELLAPGEVANSVVHAVAALVSLWGGVPDRQSTLADDPATIRTAIEAARADVLLFIGGASVGTRDYLRSVVAEL